MPNAPYVNPPVNPQVQQAADGIYFGWMGLAQDATFQANMSLIIKNGMVAALVDPTVIAAHTLAIKNALIDPAVIAASTLAIKNAINDPTTLANWEALIEQGIEDAVIDLIAGGFIPAKADWKKAFVLLAMASITVRKATLMESQEPDELTALKVRINQVEAGVL